MGRTEGMSGAHAVTGWDDDEAVSIIKSQAHLEGALLPMLHALQERFGYVDRRAIPTLADVLNVSQAEVHGTITFYHDFRSEPAGRHVIKICRAEACQSMGCNALIDHLADAHGLPLGKTTPDRSLTVEAVFCLGNCALAPAALVGEDRLIGRLDTQKLDNLVHDLSGGRA